VSDIFFKFPTTPHLVTLGGVDIRSDKVMSDVEREAFLQHDLVVEEKVDGSNIGISFSVEGSLKVQNRGDYLQLPASGQWKKLDEWLHLHAERLFDHLIDQYILFGEWCYAKHSIFYNQLPDWFLGFDIYDKIIGRFLSTIRRDRFLESMNIAGVPVIAHGRFRLADLKDLLSQSKLGDQPAEGLYLRIDHGEWLEQRAKLVRPQFIQTLEEHWSRYSITPNRLRELLG